MKLLLDTHAFLWSAGAPERLSVEAQDLINSRGVQVFFSVASVWEAAVKRGLERSDFQIDVAQ